MVLELGAAAKRLADAHVALDIEVERLGELDDVADDNPVWVEWMEAERGIDSVVLAFLLAHTRDEAGDLVHDELSEIGVLKRLCLSAGIVPADWESWRGMTETLVPLAQYVKTWDEMLDEEGWLS
jgi:hypothetical protein